jgi:hypothetical protein
MSKKGIHGQGTSTDHDAEAETEGGGEKRVALLDAKVALAREEADRDVDADDRGAQDACEAAEATHDPASRVVVHGTGVDGARSDWLLGCAGKVGSQWKRQVL